jgi:hypothetical protein
MKKALFILLLLVLIFPVTVTAGTVCLEWTANSEEDLAGYRAFARQVKGSYDYALPAWEGVETTCCIENLDMKKLNLFVVRAFDIEGFESGNSDEVYLSNGPPASPGNLIVLPQGN